MAAVINDQLIKQLASSATYVSLYNVMYMCNGWQTCVCVHIYQRAPDSPGGPGNGTMAMPQLINARAIGTPNVQCKWHDKLIDDIDYL